MWRELLKNGPKSNATSEEIKEWKERIQVARIKDEKKFQNKIKSLEMQWSKDEWLNMKKELNKLSLEQLRRLSDKVGITFSNGNDSVIDRPQMSAKEQFIMVLDEVPKIDLLRKFEIIKNI
ncbi:MAG: hypothetical protein AAB637_01145 [Patescibacteria group bacterium]